jgi:hypothetical protein
VLGDVLGDVSGEVTHEPLTRARMVMYVAGSQGLALQSPVAARKEECHVD